MFQEELRDTLLRSLSETGAHGTGLRLRLRLADTPELAGLPWEFLYDPRRNRFLALSYRTPLVRYLDLPDPPRPLQVEGPLRLLVMISSPSDYPTLEVEQEWRTLSEALAPLQTAGQVLVERLEAASLAGLQPRLRREEFHVFHFIGHGGYRPDWGDGVLVMEDASGRGREVPGEEPGRAARRPRPDAPGSAQRLRGCPQRRHRPLRRGRPEPDPAGPARGGGDAV